MTQTDIYFYSPFSIKNVGTKENRAILLQFLLTEYFQGMDIKKEKNPLEFVFTSPASFFPYDWSDPVGCLNKIFEHSSLLSYAFPNLKKAAKEYNSFVYQLINEFIELKKTKNKTIHEKFKRDLQKLYFLLEPFLIACKNSEDLLLFLLKNANKIIKLGDLDNINSLLGKMFPNGIKSIAPLIREGYKNRGFDTFLPEIDKIISNYAI